MWSNILSTLRTFKLSGYYFILDVGGYRKEEVATFCPLSVEFKGDIDGVLGGEVSFADWA